MKQYEPYIQNDNNNNNNIIIILKWKKKINQKGAKMASGGESVGERDLFYFFLSFLFSKIYGNRTVGFHRG